MDINTRRKRILEAIIKAYIRTASPVSSEAVYKSIDLGVSPATIRNDMAELEEEDMILQCHTSSGRVPTQKGYRYYVNLLLEEDKCNPSASDKERIMNEYKDYHNRFDIEQMLVCTSHMLSEFTNNVGVVLFPKLQQDCLKRIEIISLGGKRILSVIVTSSGFSKSVVLNLKEDVKDAQLHSVSRFLNSELQDVRLDELEARLVARLLNESDSFYHLLKIAIEIIRKSLSINEHARLYIEGADRAAKQPEFTNPHIIRVFLHVLEDRVSLTKVLQEDMEYDTVNIHIGEEDLSREMKDFSIISKVYRMQGKCVGIVGVIGPVRMDYSKIIAVVDYTAGQVSHFLTRVD